MIYVLILLQLIIAASAAFLCVCSIASRDYLWAALFGLVFGLNAGMLYYGQVLA